MQPMLLHIPGHPLKTCPYYGDSAALANFIFKKYGISESLYWLDVSSSGSTARLRLRLLGGKGGFGSNLRAQGSKMASKRRSGARESCRDLAGRRISTLNQAKLISEYLARKPELERRREREIREKMVKAIEKAERRPIFEDVEYLRTARETVDTVESAVLQALLSEEDHEDDNEGKEPESGASTSNSDKGKEKVTTL